MEKTWKLYILKCRDGSLYTGITTDIEKRVQAHNSGKGAKYTRSRKPVELVYFRNCDDHSHALRCEMDVKKLSKEDKWNLINDALAHQ